MTDRTPTIIIRADGSSQIGLGHLMRCLALAQGLRRAGAGVAFLCREADGTAQRLLAPAGFSIETMPEGRSEADEAGVTVAHARRLGAGLIVVDHYGLGEVYRCALMGAGLPVAMFDDVAEAGAITAAAILNQNLGAGALADRYRRIAPGARALMLGDRFFLLRETLALAGEFIRTGRLARWDQIETGLRRPRLLVMMGGADTLGLTPRLIAQLTPRRGDWEQILVVCGPAMPAALEQEARRAAEGLTQFTIARSPDLTDWYALADVAITAGGSSTMELAYCGVPMLIIQTADNQRLIGEAFRDKGLAAVLGAEEALAGGVGETAGRWPAEFSRLRDQAARLMNTIDEAGADRAAARLLALASS